MRVKPICTTLQSVRGVPIHGYITGRGIDWSRPTESRDFEGIDVDAWVREVFAATDRVLAPELAGAASRLSANDGVDHLAPVRDAKQRLARSFKTLLVPVRMSDPVDSAEQRAAQDAFEAMLQERLSNAWLPQTSDVLREYPALPEMVSQAAQPAATSAWTFAFTYRRESHPAQDIIQGKVRFNRCDAPRDAKPQKSGSPRADAPRDAGAAGSGSAAGGGRGAGGAAGQREAAATPTQAFLSALAEFTTTTPDVERDLTQWLAPLGQSGGDALGDNAALVNARIALQAFSALLTRVAAHWVSFPASAADTAAMKTSGDLYAFAIREQSIAIDDASALLVSIHGSTPPGSGAPRVDIEGYIAVPHPVPGGFGYVYRAAAAPSRASAGQASDAPTADTADAPSHAALLDPEHGRTLAARTLVLPELDGAIVKDGCASLQVVRNASLPDDPAAALAEPFIYRTDWIRFPKPVQPPADEA